MKELEIRPVRPGDLDGVSSLEQLCFKDPFPPYFLSHLADSNPETFLVGISGGRVVGYAVVDRWSDHNHLVSIAVHPEARRRGIGSRLLVSLEERLDDRPLRLEVRKSNADAIQFYAKRDFVDVGPLEGYYSDGEDAIAMKRTRGKAPSSAESLEAGPVPRFLQRPRDQ